MSFVFDEREVKGIEKMFRIAPDEIKKETKKAWDREGTKIKKEIAKISFTRTSPTSVGRGPNRSYRAKGDPSGSAGTKYGHLRKSLIRKVKFKGGGRKARSFGGYLRIGYRKPGVKSKGFVGMFHEWGTRTMIARQPIKHGWESSRGAKDMIDVTNKGIIAGLERAARKS